MTHFIYLGIIILKYIFPLYDQKNNISLNISNCLPGKGKVLVAVYNNENGFPGKATSSFKSYEGKVSDNGNCTLILSEIPYGNYAISVFQDENNDGILNTNVIGIPKEGYGFSNDAHNPFGPPDFKDCIFAHKGETNLTIKLKRW